MTFGAAWARDVRQTKRLVLLLQRFHRRLATWGRFSQSWFGLPSVSSRMGNLMPIEGD